MNTISEFRESFLEFLDKYSSRVEMLEREIEILKDINAKLQSDLLEKNEVIKQHEEAK